jgi:hypothetical protein
MFARCSLLGLLAALACACGGKVDRDVTVADEIARTPTLDASVPSARPSAARCARRAPRKQRKSQGESGSERWLSGLDGAAPVTGLARDAQGNVLVARSGTELQELDPSGALVWSQPYGELVAVDERDHVFVAGRLTSALTVAPGSTLDPADGSAYIVELDHAGAGDVRVLYAVAVGGSDADGSDAPEVLSLAVDADSNAVVSGTGLGTVLVDAAGRVRWS